jgi:hypothetical protein
MSKNVSDKLKWLETALQFALKINDDTVKSAFPSLYSSIAKCYEDLSDPDKAKKNYELATLFKDKPSDKGSFYHGTQADLQVGDFLTAGGSSIYKPEYMTTLQVQWNPEPKLLERFAQLARKRGQTTEFIITEACQSFELFPLMISP